MRKILIGILLLTSLTGFSQSNPVAVRRVINSTSLFVTGLSPGTIVTDASTNKTYRIVQPVAGTKSISTLVENYDYVEIFGIPSNSQWVKSYDYLGNIVNVSKVDQNNNFVLARPQLFQNQLSEYDAGMVYRDIPLRLAVYGDSVGYRWRVGGYELGKLFGLADGTGATYYRRLGINGDINIPTGKSYLVNADTLPLTSVKQFTSLALKTRLTDETGSGLAVFATSPALTTPNITTYIRPASAGSASLGYAAMPFSTLFLSGAAGSPSSNYFTFTGTPTTARTITFPDATGTVALTANKLSVFAATTSAELAGVISDETGTGALMFATVPTVTDSLLLPVRAYGATWQTSTRAANEGAIWNKIETLQPTITPAALTKTDDTNVTLTLGGTPATSLLQATSLTLGWTGTLADGRIASAATWNAKAPLASPTFTGTVTIPTPFTLGAVSVTTTGTRLNYLASAGGTTGTTSTNLVFSTSPVLVTPTIGAAAGTSLSLTGQLTSTLAVGTSPFAITSTTLNTNLNADLLGGYHASSFSLVAADDSIANNIYFKSADALGNGINLWKVDVNKNFVVAQNQLFKSDLSEFDAGMVYRNIPLRSAVYGDSVGYRWRAGGYELAKLWGIGDGTGGLASKGIWIGGDVALAKGMRGIFIDQDDAADNSLWFRAGRNTTGYGAKLTLYSDGNSSYPGYIRALISEGSAGRFVISYSGDIFTVESTGDVTTTGNVMIADSKSVKFGAGADMEIYSDGSNAIFKANADIYFKDASGNMQLLINDAMASGVVLYGNGGAKLQTSSTGVGITGVVSGADSVLLPVRAYGATWNKSTRAANEGAIWDKFEALTPFSSSTSYNWGANQTLNDGYKWLLGTSGADGELYSDGTDNIFKLVGGADYKIINASSTTMYRTDGSHNYLYDGGSVKLQTLTTGVAITGAASVSGEIDALNYKTLTVSLSNAQLQALNGTPIKIIDAVGAGYAIQVFPYMSSYYYTYSTASMTNAPLTFIYTNGTTYNADHFAVIPTFNGNADRSGFLGVGAGSGIFLSNTDVYVRSDANFTFDPGGAGTMKIYVVYRIITL